MTHYIEDILHLLVDTIGISDNDSQILNSISKQCKKGTALTDRQYELVKNKLESKAELLSEHGVVLGEYITRLPIREIDRSKYIKVVSRGEIHDNHVYESYKANEIWFKVRFPFSKKHIVKLEGIISKCRRRGKNYTHVKGSHEHFFKKDPNIAFALVEAYEKCDFDIEQQIVDMAKETKKIKDNYKDYMPHYADNQFYNVDNSVIEQIDIDDIYQIKDNRLRHGYATTVNTDNSTLLDIVVNRPKAEVLADPAHYNMHNIAETFERLNRYPIIVVIDANNEYEQVKEVYNAFNMLVPNEQQSVLFRIENTDTENFQLNDFIKNHNLNNWVDSKTKIVYIRKNKLPKVLLNSGFTPKTMLGKTSYRLNSMVTSYVTFNCDLIVFNDDTSSSFNRFSF